MTYIYAQIFQSYIWKYLYVAISNDGKFIMRLMIWSDQLQVIIISLLKKKERRKNGIYHQILNTSCITIICSLHPIADSNNNALFRLHVTHYVLPHSSFRPKYMRSSDSHNCTSSAKVKPYPNHHYHVGLFSKYARKVITDKHSQYY